MADDEPVKEEVAKESPAEKKVVIEIPIEDASTGDDRPVEEASTGDDKPAEEASEGETNASEDPKAEEKSETEDKPDTETVAEKEDKKPAEETAETEPEPKSKEEKPEDKPTEERPEKASTGGDKSVEEVSGKTSPVKEASTEKDKSAKAPPKEEDKPVEEVSSKEEKSKVRGPKKAVGLPPEKVLLFGKYNMAEVVVHDPGLERYLNLDPIIVAHTGAKHANRSFGKSKMHIIERLVNNMMRTEKFTGKKTKAYKVVKNAFEIIEKRTKTHPVQVFIDALENSAPREEVTRLRYGGISVPKAVDTSASRRLDLAFRHITKGAVSSSYKSVKSIDMCLANEIMLAAKKDMNSFAVSKKEELERIASSAR